MDLLIKLLKTFRGFSDWKRDCCYFYYWV